MTSSAADIRQWLFRAMMFEADAEVFRTAGVRVGAAQLDVEASLMEEVLRPFPIPLRNEAMRMTRLYALIYCFENSVRQLIAQRLSERRGADWWATDAVPNKVRSVSDSRRAAATSNSWLEGEKSDPLQFVEFGQLADIVISNWDEFSDLVPTQHWLKQRMDELEQARNYIAHNRLLMPGEFRRLESHVTDWLRQVGV
ncbi:conserved hypothetical protein [Hyphomicrobium sp. GJ21]|uniref:Swt1 family HEPN domain-containing protein n=1 Tax=Hyphomicrobium sp. GJ21 TaxID=113574 RepID=UPI000622B9E4|nr:Swt1 family HEPN domain-containing protein [Hyphomicrobium sp. GJ21]CEJ89120.1 conserved hypothetical protein [Hyphomicrobium sp. GJ21]